MNRSYKICKNLKFLHLGSGIMNNETLRKAQQNTRMGKSFSQGDQKFRES